jgi:hypothetical protein
MSPYSYSAEFAAGHRATLTVRDTAISINWTPDVPNFSGQRLHKFLEAYRMWRNDCLADFAKRAGVRVAVIELPVSGRSRKQT